MARAPAIRQIEAEDALPEADCLDGFLHPRETQELFGHQEAEQELADGHASRSLHHAFLMCGLRGIGKATLAYRFAKHALSRNENTSSLALLDDAAGCPAHLQVQAGVHPNLLSIRRTWNIKTKKHMQVISVDEVRRLKGFLSLTADPTVPRIIIVDQADELNVAAANALLKSLEEPPANAIFFLISSEPDRLLPTIRSRCRKLDLAIPALDDHEAAANQALTSADLDEISGDAAKRLSVISQGSIRQTLALLGADGLSLYDDVFKLLSSLPSLNYERLHTVTDKLSLAAAEQSFATSLDLLNGTLTRMIGSVAAGKPALEAEEAVAARIIAPELLFEWAQAWEDMQRDRARVAALNLDKKTFLMDIFFRLETLARSAHK